MHVSCGRPILCRHTVQLALRSLEVCHQISECRFKLTNMQHLLVVAAAIVSLFGTSIATPQPSSTVRTSSGSLIGHAAANRTLVSEFLGIRYAEAPIGNLRFAAPKKYRAPQGTVFKASDWVSDINQSNRPTSTNKCSQRMYESE